MEEELYNEQKSSGVCQELCLPWRLESSGSWVALEVNELGASCGFASCGWWEAWLGLVEAFPLLLLRLSSMSLVTHEWMLQFSLHEVFCPSASCLHCKTQPWDCSSGKCHWNFFYIFKDFTAGLEWAASSKRLGREILCKGVYVHGTKGLNCNTSAPRVQAKLTQTVSLDIAQLWSPWCYNHKITAFSVALPHPCNCPGLKKQTVVEKKYWVAHPE